MNRIETVMTTDLDAMGVPGHLSGKTPRKHTTMNHNETVIRHDFLGSALGRPVDRRHLLKMIGAGAAALAVGTASKPGSTSARSTDTLIVNTEGARLRSGAGTGYAVLASLSKGTEVQYVANGGSANGYQWYQVKVYATGKVGFVASSLLSAPDGGTGSDPVIVGTATTTDFVNLRSGPSTGHQVLRVVPSGASVQISSTVQGGFRYVIHNGLAGWISDQYLKSGGSQPGGETFTTTSALNLRAEPSTSAKVLLVMPSGAVVKALSGTASGWRQVSYNGTTGWAATDYLN
jgi:uncharacterized protein YgiM (DUF1202 family)